MTSNLLKQINKEIYIFLSLSVVNIIFGAISLAMGIVLIVNNLLNLINLNIFIDISLLYIIAGFGLAGIGFWWLLYSVSLMDFITDIQIKFLKKNQKITEEKITSLIVKMVSYYRKYNTNIRRMIFIARLGGLFFIINGIISTVDLFYKINPYNQLSNYYMQIAGILLMFIWGILSFLIPRFIKKFATLWEHRIKKSSEAEETIRRLSSIADGSYFPSAHKGNREKW